MRSRIGNRTCASCVANMRRDDDIYYLFADWRFWIAVAVACAVDVGLVYLMYLIACRMSAHT